MHQVAVFTDPKVTSTVTANLEAKNAKGGIHCTLHNAPQAPQSDAIFKNGQWEEVSSAAHAPNSGNPFTFSLNADDEATTNLLSSLRDKKTIGEMVVYELDTTSNKEQYGYYFHKVFVKGFKPVDNEKGEKLWNFDCSCMSFKQKDKNNNEPVLWDSDTNTNKYTGSAR